MLARHLGWVVGYSPQLGWRVMMYNSSEMHSTSEECSDNNNVCRDLCTPGTRGTLSMLVSRVHTVSVLLMWYYCCTTTVTMHRTQAAISKLPPYDTRLTGLYLRYPHVNGCQPSRQTFVSPTSARSKGQFISESLS